MSGIFEGFNNFISGNNNINPCRQGKAYTPDAAGDVQDFKFPVREVRVGGVAGNLVVLLVDEKDDSKFVTIPVQAYDVVNTHLYRRILSTTTASPLLIFW